jgi:hypothetical protein
MRVEHGGHLKGLLLVATLFSLVINSVFAFENCELSFQRPSVSVHGFVEVCLLWRINSTMTLDGLCKEQTSSYAGRCDQTLEDCTEIALATHGTIDRLERIALQAKRWSGKVFAALHIKDEADKQAILEFRANHPSIRLTVVRSQVDLENKYPTNLMRNLVLWSVSIEHLNKVLLLDADAIPNHSSAAVGKDLDNAVSAIGSGRKRKLLFVLPAFELATTSDLIPVEKSEIVHLLHQNKARTMHQPKISYDINIAKWIDSADGFEMPYILMNEHYVVAQLSTIMHDHMFDEKFIGRGFNKQSIHFELWADGYDYLVLGQSFLINLQNPAPIRQPKSNPQLDSKPIWMDFRGKVATRFGLVCRESFWRTCDEKGLHCDKVCTRPNHSLPTRAVIYDDMLSQAGVTSSWAAFERKANRKAEESQKNGRRLRTSRTECLSQIDVVYTWVNGSEPGHIADRHLHIPAQAFENEIELGNKRKLKNHELKFRFRDFGEVGSTLKHSIRSLTLHAPWIRNIYIVVADGQKLPSFLNSSSERIILVPHSTIMRKDCLPTFNSCAIESRLHIIPNLSECFLYLNDDVILLNTLKPELYWPDGYAIPNVVFDGVEAPERSKDEWQSKLAYVAKLLKHNLELPKVFLVGHHGHFMVKEIIEEIYSSEQFEQELRRTECERWRTNRSVWLPLIYSNFYLARWSPFIMRESAFYHPLTDLGGLGALRRVFRQIHHEQHRWLCLNDLLGPNVDDNLIKAMEQELCRLIPLSADEGLRSALFNEGAMESCDL